MKRPTLVVLATLAVAAAATAAGSLPRSRINDVCRWTEGGAGTVGAPAGRAHLVTDVEVAEELGIRWPDRTVGHVNSPVTREMRARCTERSLAAVARQHGLSRGEVEALRGVRQWWLDPLAVFLPLAVLFALVARPVVARVVSGYERDDWPVAALVLAVLAPLAGGGAVGAAQLWSWTVEMLRLNDGHLSYRAFYLAGGRHGWAVFGVATALFAAVAVDVVRRRRAESGPARRGRLLATS